MGLRKSRYRRLLSGLYFEHESSSTVEMYWNCLRANEFSPALLSSAMPRPKSGYLRHGFVDASGIAKQRAGHTAILLRQLKAEPAPAAMATIELIQKQEGKLSTKICPECAELGIHSTIFLLPCIARCPVHDTELTYFMRSDIPEFRDAPKTRRRVTNELDIVNQKLDVFYNRFYRRYVPVRPFWGVRLPVQLEHLELAWIATQPDSTLLKYFDSDSNVEVSEIGLTDRRKGTASHADRLVRIFAKAQAELIDEVGAYLKEAKERGIVGGDIYCKTEDCVKHWKQKMSRVRDRGEFMRRLAFKFSGFWVFRPEHLTECVYHPYIFRRLDISWLDDSGLARLVRYELLRSLSAVNLFIKCRSAGLPTELEEIYFWRLLPSRSPAVLLLYDKSPKMLLQTFTVAEALEDVIPPAERMSRVRVVRDRYE